MKLLPHCRRVKIRIEVGGVACYTLSNLKTNFCVSDICQFVSDGRLVRWLKNQNKDDLARKVNQVHTDLIQKYNLKLITAKNSVAKAKKTDEAGSDEQTQKNLRSAEQQLREVNGAMFQDCAKKLLCEFFPTKFAKSEDELEVIKKLLEMHTENGSGFESPESLLQIFQVFGANGDTGNNTEKSQLFLNYVKDNWQNLEKELTDEVLESLIEPYRKDEQIASLWKQYDEQHNKIEITDDLEIETTIRRSKTKEDAQWAFPETIKGAQVQFEMLRWEDFSCCESKEQLQPFCEKVAACLRRLLRYNEEYRPHTLTNLQKIRYNILPHLNGRKLWANFWACPPYFDDALNELDLQKLTISYSEPICEAICFIKNLINWAKRGTTWQMYTQMVPEDFRNGKIGEELLTLMREKDEVCALCYTTALNENTIFDEKHFVDMTLWQKILYVTFVTIRKVENIVED